VWHKKGGGGEKKKKKKKGKGNAPGHLNTLEQKKIPGRRWRCSTEKKKGKKRQAKGEKKKMNGFKAPIEPKSDDPKRKEGVRGGVTGPVILTHGVNAGYQRGKKDTLKTCQIIHEERVKGVGCRGKETFKCERTEKTSAGREQQEWIAKVVVAHKRKRKVSDQKKKGREETWF